jgi:hypothetical protein
MVYKQLKSFDITKMGTRVGYCLANVRQGFGIAPKYASAKDAMLGNKNAGTLHDISTLPTNVAVPVFLDTSSPYEHVIVSDHGALYSDGKRLTSLAGFKAFGWGEYLNGVHIVEMVPETTKKTNEQIADEVIALKWGVAPKRYDLLREAGYDPTTIQEIVNQKLKGGPTSAAPMPTVISVGTRVLPISWVDYNGKVLKKTRNFYFVQQINGDRAVLVADSMKGAVYAAINTKNLRIV